MFVTQAHSFVQQARLAITLAWVAGCTNILTILTCGQVTSHISGTASNLGRDVAEGAWAVAAYPLWLLMAFFIGAAASAVMTEIGRRRGWESIYILPMAIEAVLLALFAIGVEIHDPASRETGAGLYWLTGLASLAMGLQNATITRISGGVVRTTHATGILTDLGLESVQFALWAWDKRRDFPPGSARAIMHSVRVHPTARRLALLATIIASFTLGAGLGTLAFSHFPRYAMFPPVLFLLWLVYQDVRRPISELEPSDLISRDYGLDVPKTLAVFHLRKNAAGRAGIHRMPNLLVWADRLPQETQVIILDLSEIAKLNGNAVLEVRAVLDRLEAQGRRLILSGISPERFAKLRRAGGRNCIDVTGVSPDLGLAIARGLAKIFELAHARAANSEDGL
mgnify:CR=1 FL=1